MKRWYGSHNTGNKSSVIIRMANFSDDQSSDDSYIVRAYFEEFLSASTISKNVQKMRHCCSIKLILKFYYFAVPKLFKFLIEKFDKLCSSLEIIKISKTK